MVHMDEACEECTQNCRMMHKQNKNPSPVVTTFFKVMFGDDYSKVLFLPPRISRSLKNKIGKSTWLEDSSGEKWDVKFTEVGGVLAFKKGWNKFVSEHDLKLGDFLVFHYIMESYFVVLMYGPSGCPEIRHFGFPQNTKKNDKLTADDHRPPDNDTNDFHCSNELSSQSEHTQQVKKRDKKKEEDDIVPPNVDITHTDHLFASPSQPGTSSSDKEASQRSEPLLRDTDPNNMVYETATTVNQICGDANNGHVEDESRIINVQADMVDSYGGRKNYVLAGGDGLDKTKGFDIWKRVEERIAKRKGSNMAPSEATCSDPETQVKLAFEKPKESMAERKESNMEPSEATGSKRETQVKVAAEKPKEIIVAPTKATCSNLPKKRSRNEEDEVTPAKIHKKEPGTSGSRLHNDGRPPTSTGNLTKPTAKPVDLMKKELTVNHGSAKTAQIVKKEPETSGSRLHNGTCPPIPTGNLSKPTAKGTTDVTNKEKSTNSDSGCKSKDNKMDVYKSHTKENDNTLMRVKDEPEDYGETPLSGSPNISFSAVMNTYNYLELPDRVKWNRNSKVILLRNGTDLWPVLFELKLGLNALTQSWGLFAKAKGIKPGDKCDFVLERQADSRHSCRVYNVHVTRT